MTYSDSVCLYVSIQYSGKMKHNRTLLKADIQICHEAVIDKQRQMFNHCVHYT